MSKGELTKKEKEVLVDLICFIFEHEEVIRRIYDKLTMYDSVFYVSENLKKDG